MNMTSHTVHRWRLFAFVTVLGCSISFGQNGADSITQRDSGGMMLAAAGNGADVSIKSHESQRERIPVSLRESTPAAAAEMEDEFGKILTLKPAKRWSLTPYARARGFWTSNALFGRGPGEQGDTVFVHTEGLDTAYSLTDDWRVFAGYGFSQTRYDEHPAIDYDTQNTEFGTTYRLPFAQDLRAGAGIRGLWLKSPVQEVELYREASPYLNLFNTHRFLDDRLSWFYGYEFSEKFTNPVVSDHDEHTLFTGIGYNWLPNLTSQMVLSGNWQLYDYRPTPPQANTPYQGRQEQNETVSLQTVWQPLSWLQVMAFASATDNNSSGNSNRDYKVANVGGEVRAFYQFDLGPDAVSDKRKKSSFRSEPELREPVDRTLEVRAGPRFGQLFGSTRLGQTGTDIDLRDDLDLDENFVTGTQFNANWQVFKQWHLDFEYTYDRYNQRGHARRNIFKGGSASPLLAGSAVDGVADLHTVALTVEYDAYKDNTWVITPFVGGKGAFVEEELFVADVNNRFTLSGKGVQSMAFGTPLVGAEIKAFLSRNWYTGIRAGGFGMDEWHYVHGQAYTGYDFNDHWGMRLGFDVNYGSYENSSKSLLAEGGLGSLFTQVIYGF